ncbi:hypothetical protein [Arthrobacter sp. SDTb3-6]|uniref:hypothetical protein n=1 Tax=Arthrobacter sp. SDTb3-6 TaxID=2713571 RepID=UPI00210B95BD|nr:hypothetical protein [Arthrobacter sp. SDTb3-6]
MAADAAPKYERKPAGSSFDAFEKDVRRLLVVSPRMPATVLAERVGWSGSSSLFRAKVAAIRPEYAPADPADRLVHEPGKTVQCDLWFPHQPLPLGYGQEGKPPVLVMTSAYSGFVQARMIPSRTTEDLLGGMWELIQEADAVPARLLWDFRDRDRPGEAHRACQCVRRGAGHRDQAPAAEGSANPKAWWSG